MTILETIISAKRKEVEDKKQRCSIRDMEASPLFQRPAFSLKAFILDPGRTGIIAEFKRKSPSKGIINHHSLVEDVTRDYTEAGASALSVLTDEDFFGGSSADLQKARVNHIPILRKDFIIDEFQVLEAKAMGADAILLIAACLGPAEVKKLAAFAKGAGLEILLELHDDNELEHINQDTEIVGINNRNLKTFEVDMDKSIRMAERIGSERIRVAESGISKPEDIVEFRNYGFDGFLIGERFMKENDPGQAFRSFVASLKSLA
jgi:indole-3-glycerol phosphate synthase